MSSIVTNTQTTIILTTNWQIIFSDFPIGIHFLCICDNNNCDGILEICECRDNQGTIQSIVKKYCGILQFIPLYDYTLNNGKFCYFYNPNTYQEIEIKRNNQALQVRLLSGSNLSLTFSCTSIITITNNLLPTAKLLTLSVPGINGISINNNFEYISIFRFLFPGTNVFQPTKCYIIADTSSSMDIRIRNVTNNNSIVLSKTISNIIPENIIDLGNFSNLSENPSYFILEAKGSSGTIYSMCMYS